MATIAAIEAIAVNVSPKTNWTFVAVTDSMGSTGWGECSLNGWEELLVAEVGRVSRGVVGGDIDGVGEVLRCFSHTPGGLVSHAVASAIEQALVDLRARHAGIAIAAHLGPSPRQSIPAYANINRSVTERSPAAFATAAQRAVAAGYRAIKLAPFDGVIAEDAATTPIDARIRAGLDRVFAVRDAIGTAPALMVDCHWRFDEPRAVQLIRDLVPARLHWIECPVSEHPSWFPVIARLTRLAREFGMKSAGGEMIACVDQGEALCEAGLYDVLMPDIKYAGGYRGMLEIARICERHGKEFSPHNPTGPIAHVASVHLCAASPTLLWLEHQWNESPLFESLIGVAADLVDGAFVVPAAPGLGARLDRDLARSRPWQPLPVGANLDPRLG
jgi:galactonate dehydratase